MKKFIFSAAVIFGIMLLPKPSFAYTQYFQQPNQGNFAEVISGVTTTIPLGSSTFSWAAGVGNGYGVVALGFYVSSTYDTTKDITAGLFDVTTGQNIGTTGIAKTTVGGNCREVHDATTTQIWIGMPCTGSGGAVNIGDTLELTLYYNSPGTHQFLAGGSTDADIAFVIANATGTANTDCNFPNTGAGCSTSWTPMADYLRTIVTPPVAGSVQLLYPQNNATIPDFSNWVVNVTTTASSTFGTLKVNYGQSSGTLQFHDQQQFSIFVSQNPAPIQKTILLNPIVNLTATSTWYAQAEYDYGASSTVVTSSIISFIISPTATTTISTTTILANPISNLPLNNPSSTLNNPLPYSDCDLSHLGGCLSNAGVFIAAFLFRPSQGINQYFSNSLSSLKLSFPFSLIFGIHDIVQGDTATLGASAPSLVLPVPAMLIPYVGSTGITLISSSTLSNLVGGGSNGIAFKALIFAIEDAIIFVGVVVLIYLQVAGKKK